MSPQTTQVISLTTSPTSPRSSSNPLPNAVDNPDYIPRPRNAFIIFRAGRSKKYQGRTAGDISQLVAAEWRSLSADARAQYERQADEEKQRHKVLYPHYRFQPKQKPKVKDKEERVQLETRVTEKLEHRRAQKRAARARAKKKREMESVIQQMAPMPLPVPLVYPSQLDSTSHLPFIPVLIPNPAYLAQVPTNITATHIDPTVPPLAPPSPPSQADHGLDSGPVTPVVAGSPVRAPLEVAIPGKMEDRAAIAASPIIASASPIQQNATVDPSFLKWSAACDPPPPPLCGYDNFTHEGPCASWFDWPMPPLSSPEFDRSFYSNPFSSTSSLQLSEVSNDSGDWSTLMDAFGPGPGPWDLEPIFNPLVTCTTSTTAVSFTNTTLTHFPSAPVPTSAAAGPRRSVGRQPSLRLDGLFSYDGTFDAGLSVLPEWSNCLGLENGEGQRFIF